TNDLDSVRLGGGLFDEGLRLGHVVIAAQDELRGAEELTFFEGLSQVIRRSKGNPRGCPQAPSRAAPTSKQSRYFPGLYIHIDATETGVGRCPRHQTDRTRAGAEKLRARVHQNVPDGQHPTFWHALECRLVA